MKTDRFFKNGNEAYRLDDVTCFDVQRARNVEIWTVRAFISSMGGESNVRVWRTLKNDFKSEAEGWAFVKAILAGEHDL